MCGKRRTRLLLWLVLALPACTTAPTEVLVSFNSDAVVGRMASIGATVRLGRTTSGTADVHTWDRDTISLPASFAIVPSATESDPDMATLVLGMQIPPGINGEPAVSFERIAHVTFTPHQTTNVAIFLSVACGAARTGCSNNSVPCTMSEWCEEQGLTCGDDAQCVSTDVSTTSLSDASEVSVEVSDATASGDGLDGPQDGRGDAATEVEADALEAEAPTCTEGMHVCNGQCAANASTATCGTLCQPCPSDALGSASCDGAMCHLVCDMGTVYDGTSCAIMPPRPVAPLSTTIVTSRRPVFEWANASGGAGASVEVCSDRACAHSVGSFMATGTQLAPSTDLPTGVLFWRLHGVVNATVGTQTSAVWEVSIPATGANLSISAGSVSDVNGDGLADALVGTDVTANVAGHAYVYFGSSNGGIAAQPNVTLTAPMTGNLRSLHRERWRHDQRRRFWGHHRGRSQHGEHSDTRALVCTSDLRRDPTPHRLPCCRVRFRPPNNSAPSWAQRGTSITMDTPMWSSARPDRPVMPGACTSISAPPPGCRARRR